MRIPMMRHFSTRGTDLWSVIFAVCAILTGGLSYGSSSSRVDKCLIIGILIMSIFSVISGGVLVALSVQYICTEYSGGQYSTELVMHSVLCTVGVTTIVMSLVSSSLACQSLCCRPKTTLFLDSQVIYSKTRDPDHAFITGEIHQSESQELAESKHFMYKQFK